MEEKPRKRFCISRKRWYISSFLFRNSRGTRPAASGARNGESTEMNRKPTLKQAFVSSLPVLMGYTTMGFAAGVLLAAKSGIRLPALWADPVDSSAFSLVFSCPHRVFHLRRHVCADMRGSFRIVSVFQNDSRKVFKFFSTFFPHFFHKCQLLKNGVKYRENAVFHSFRNPLLLRRQ